MIAVSKLLTNLKSMNFFSLKNGRKPRLLIDQDEVLAETMAEMVLRFNKDHGTNYTIQDIKTWDLSESFVGLEKALHYFRQEGFFYSLKPTDGAIEVMEDLISRYDVFIVTAGEPCSHGDKERWVKEYMPFFPIDNIIFCKRKGAVWGDVLLDDAPHNLNDFKDIGLPVIFDRPHNKTVKDFDRVNSFYEFRDFVDSIFYPNLLVKSSV